MSIECVVRQFMPLGLLPGLDSVKDLPGLDSVREHVPRFGIVELNYMQCITTSVREICISLALLML